MYIVRLFACFSIFAWAATNITIATWEGRQGQVDILAFTASVGLIAYALNEEGPNE